MKKVSLSLTTGKTNTKVVSHSLGIGNAIRAYCETALKQTTTVPEIIIQIAPHYIDHIKTAQHHAHIFIDDIQPVMLQHASDLISFSNKWKSFSPSLVQYAKEGKYDLVAQGLSFLKDNITVYSTNAHNAVNQLNVYQKKVIADERAFNVDYQLLTDKKAGIPAQIHAYDEEIDALNKAIAIASAEIAAGAVAVVIGSLLIVAGSVGDILTGGAANGVIVAGGVVAAGGAAAIIHGCISLEKDSRRLAKVTSEKAALNQELSLVKTYNTNLSNLVHSTSSAVTAIGHLSTAWQSLGADIDSVIYDIKSAKGTIKLPWFAAEMQAADADWAMVSKMAEAVQLQVANATFKTIDLSKKGASLISALPSKDQQRIAKVA